MISGIGIDIIEIARIQRTIDRWGDTFLKRVFTPEEIDYSRKSANSTRRFAARFAAKEAVFKAVGDDRTLTWQDISVSNDKHGRPCCTIKRNNFNNQILISLSHSDHYAVANAIITPQS